MGQNSTPGNTRHNSISSETSTVKDAFPRPSAFLLEPNKVPQSRWLISSDEESTTASGSLLSSPPPPLPPPPIPARRVPPSPKTRSQLNRWRSFGVSLESLCVFFYVMGVQIIISA